MRFLFHFSLFFSRFLYSFLIAVLLISWTFLIPNSVNCSGGIKNTILCLCCSFGNGFIVYFFNLFRQRYALFAIIQIIVAINNHSKLLHYLHLYQNKLYLC